MKNNITKKDLVYLLIIINIIIWANSYVKAKNWYSEYINIAVGRAEASEIKEEEENLKTGSLEWILSECEKNNIDPIKVKCLLKHESGFSPNAIGQNSTTVDLGLFQWNSKWQINPGFITLGCIGNPECETQKFIEKIKQDKSFGAWHGYTNHCLWLGENPFIN